MSYSRFQRRDDGVTVTVKFMMNKLRITRSEFSVLLRTSRKLERNEIASEWITGNRFY